MKTDDFFLISRNNRTYKAKLSLLSDLFCLTDSVNKISAEIVAYKDKMISDAANYNDTHYSKNDIKTEFSKISSVNNLSSGSLYVNLTESTNSVTSKLSEKEIDHWYETQVNNCATILQTEFKLIKNIAGASKTESKAEEWMIDPSIEQLINESDLNLADGLSRGTTTGGSSTGGSSTGGSSTGGSSTGGSSTTNHTAPIISKSNYQFWYGSVNCWSSKVNGKYVFVDQIPRLIKAGCTGYHIEMFSWVNGSNSLINIKTAYKDLITLCRKNKMWLFVDVINGNFNGSNTKWTAGMSNYKNLTVGYIVKNYGQGLINIIKENGPQNVLIQPIGESGSKGQVNDCQKFQDMCCDQLSNYLLVTEPSRSNSSKMKKQMKYSSIHVSNSVKKVLSESDTLIKGKNDDSGSWSSASGCNIVVSDTGTAIQALASPESGSQQGWLNKWTSACSRASRLVTAVNKYKGESAVFVYYAFKFKCMGTNGSTIDGELNKGTWDSIKSIVNPKYP